MSSVKRIISGTISGIVRNFINLIIIIISLPIYLKFWDVELYGIWVLIFSIVGFLKLPIFTYQEYLQYEFLKMGKSNRFKISKLIYGSIFLTSLIFSFILLFSIIIFEFSFIMKFLNIDQKYFSIIQISIFFILGSEVIAYIVGVYTRALYPFNYYPKIHWIGSVIIITIPVFQIISLYYGFKLIDLSILTFVSTNLINFIFLIYLAKMLKKENIKYKGLFIKHNINHFINSFHLLFGNLITLLKNEGSRLIMVPFVGAIQLAAFVAMKTANNILKQLFNSFTNSLLIEFSEYINKKDKKKFIKSYIFLISILSVVIIPLAFFFQIIISDLFLLWARGKMEFDNILFASMTIAFLIMIFYQPAYLVVKSRNMFFEEMKISIINSIIFIILFIIFIQKYSIRGAGYSLIATEIIACIYFFFYANKWLGEKFVKFDKKILSYCLLDLIISSTLIMIIAKNSDNYLLIIYIFFLYKIFFGYLLFKTIFNKKYLNFFKKQNAKVN